VAVHYPAGPFRLPVHGERGESTGSLTRAPTVALLPFGERTVAQPAGRVSARSHARSERQRPRKGIHMNLGPIVRVLEDVPATIPVEREPATTPVPVEPTPRKEPAPAGAAFPARRG